MTPLLKKLSVDPYKISNHRPVSNLSFVSQLAERLWPVGWWREEKQTITEPQSFIQQFTQTPSLDENGQVMSHVFLAATNQKFTLSALLNLTVRHFTARSINLYTHARWGTTPSAWLNVSSDFFVAWVLPHYSSFFLPNVIAKFWQILNGGNRSIQMGRKI